MNIKPVNPIFFSKPTIELAQALLGMLLVNVVSGEVNSPEAILIRAIEPVIGEELMYKRRGDVKRVQNLTNGPGKLTKALGIVKEDYGLPLWGSPLYISEGEAPEMISAGPRIGIDNSGDAKEYPWRFWVSGNRFVSGTKKNNG